MDWEKPEYSIRVETIDSGGLSFEKIISINIRYRNKPPYKINLSNSNVDENLKEGTIVGYLNTSDPDKIEIHLYNLVDYNKFPDNFNFQIIKNQLRTKKRFDFEQTNKYLIKIRTSDFGGLSYEAVFEI